MTSNTNADGTAMVVHDTANTGALVVSDEDVMRLMEEYKKQGSSIATEMRTSHVIKARGATFPIRYNRGGQNKITDTTNSGQQGAGGGGGGGGNTNGSSLGSGGSIADGEQKTSFNMKVTVGSLKNVSGPESWTDDTGEYVLIKLGKGKPADKNTLPVSTVTGKQITAVLVRRGNERILFTPFPCISLPPRSIHYGVSIRPTYTFRKTSPLSDPLPGQGSSSSSVSTQSEMFQQTSVLDVDTRKRRVVTLGCSSLPRGMASVAGAPSVSSSGAGQKRPKYRGRQQQQVPSTNTTTSAGMNPDSAVANAIGDPDSWYKDVLPIPPRNRMSDISFVTQEIIDLYSDPNSGLTRDERYELELQHPEIIKVTLSSDALKQGYKFPAVTFNCDTVCPAIAEDYVGQSNDDLVAYLQKTPELETRLTPEMVHTYTGETIFVVHRPDTMFTEMFKTRMTNRNTPRFLAKLQFVESLPMKRGSDQEQSPWVCFSTKANINRMRAMFEVRITTWDPTSDKFMPDTGKSEVGLKGSIYQEQLSCVFGISNWKDWKELAPSIMPSTPLYIQCYINKTYTENLTSNKSGQVCANVAYAYVDVDTIHAEFREGLRRVGLPITAKRAGELIKKAWPIDPSELANANKRDLWSVTCLTTSPNKYATTVAVGCDYFLVTNTTAWTMGDLNTIQPEIGDLISSDKWYTKETITVPSTGAKILANDPMRVPFRAVNIYTASIKYIYAVRKDVSDSIQRAELAISTFESGGTYDYMGFPIVHSMDTLQQKVGTITGSYILFVVLFLFLIFLS